LRLLYTRGHVDIVEVVAGSVSFSDFANRVYFLQRVAHQDLDLLEEVREERRTRDEYKQTVEAQENELKKLHGIWEQKRREYAEEQAQQGVLLKKLAQERAAYESRIAANERTSREITAMLLRYHRYSPKGRARFSKRWGGSLRMPVPGPILSGFGWRVHPIYGVTKFHYGVDIGASVGTPIRAAADGIVVYSGWWGAYGNCVIIDHGSGMTTVYAHCQRLRASRGQKVSAGDAIATVGSTGLSTGPHLHFELRRQGTPVSPW
jgi:murein DD-endopeptidase MepM/ murein hydrolase activator NlpD